MLYETPKMEFIALQSDKVFTLFVSNGFDPSIDKTPGNPSDNPWAQ